MTIEAFRLVGVVEARTQQAERNLRNLDHRARATAGSMRSSFAGMGSSITSMLGGAASVLGGNILTSALGSITSAFTGGIKAGIDYNKMLQSSRLSFEVMLGSASKADALLNRLQKTAESTPFDTEGLIKYTQRMIALNFEANEVIPTIKALGDVVGAQGLAGAEASQSLGEMVRQLGQMRLKGKVSAEELNSLAEHGVKVYRYLGDELARVDKNFAKLTDAQRIKEVQKLAEAGQLNARAASQAIVRGAARDSQIAGLGERMSRETAEGKEANIADRSQRLFGEGLRTAFKRYDETLQIGLDLLNSDRASQFAAGVDKMAQSLDAAGVKLIERLKSGDLDLAGQAKEVGASVVEGVREGISSATSTAVDAVTVFGKEVIKGGKKVFGIRSPSTVFAEMGRMMALGLAQGYAQQLEGQTGRMSAETAKIVETQREKIQRLLKENAVRTNIPLDLLSALVHQESRGNTRALSSKGARGLMQLMPDTARGEGLRVGGGIDDRLDVEKNIRAGADYLRKMIDQFNGDLKLALAAYNAGPGAVLRYGGIPPYSETQGYVNNISKRVPWLFGSGNFQSSQSSGRPAWNETGAKREFLDWLYDLERSIKASDKTSVSAQSDYMHRLHVKAADVGVDDKFINAAIKLVSAALALEKAANRLGDIDSESRARRGVVVGTEAISATVPPLASRLRRVTSASSDPIQQAIAVAQAAAAVANVNAMLGSSEKNLTQATSKTTQATDEFNESLTLTEPLLQKNAAALERYSQAFADVGQAFEGSLVNALDSVAAGGGVLSAMRGFAIGFSQEVSHVFSQAFSEKLRSKLFTQTGSAESPQLGGPLGSVFDKLLRKVFGIKAPASNAAQNAVDASGRPAGGPGSVAGAGAGSAVEKLFNKLFHRHKNKGSMPESGVPEGSRSTGLETRDRVVNKIDQATDKITSAVHEMGHSLAMEGHADTDRLIDALTPRQQGFWKGLLSTVLSAAAGAAAGAAVNNALGGDGGTRPRTTTTIRDDTGEIIPGGGNSRPGTVTPRAFGGPLSRGGAYLFGENGPELGIFPANGTMLPNDHPATQMAINGRSGGAIHKHYHFNVHAHGADAAQSIKKSRRQIAREFRNMSQAA